MPRFNKIQNSFLAGELSPNAYGRTDLQEYQSGAAEITNFMVLPSGPVTRRPGTRYIKTTQGNKRARIIPFVYSRDESYAVEITDGAIRVINVKTGVVSTPTVVNSAAGASGSPSFAYYTEYDLPYIQYAQSADVMWMVIGSATTYTTPKPPQKLLRTGTDTFQLKVFDYATGISDRVPIKAYPYRDRNTTSTALKVPAATPTTIGTTFTLSSTAALFDAGHVGAFFKLTSTGITGAVRITAVSSSTSATAVIWEDIDPGLVGLAAGTKDWEEAAWSTYRGWPRTVTFFEQRLLYAGNKAQPDTIWGSMVGNYDHLMARRFSQDSTSDTSGLGYYGSTTNSDPFAVTLDSQQVNEINWISARNVLIVGTQGAEHISNGVDTTFTTGVSIGFREQTAHGSIPMQPTKIANSIAFIQRGGKKVMEMRYSLEEASFVAEHVNRYSEHLNGINLPSATAVELAWQETNQVIWARCSDGGLYGITRDKQINVLSPHRHKLGGTFADGTLGTIPGVVESIAVVPNGGLDELWLCVKRTINSSTSYFVEVLNQPFVFDQLENAVAAVSDSTSPIYSDAALIVSNSPASKTVAGLSHLVGQEVCILADGFLHPNKTVDGSGNITLDFAASKIIVGLPYTSTLKTLKLEAGAATGSSFGSVMRLDRIAVDFYRTIGVKVGTSLSNLQEILFREPDVAMNKPTPLYTGQKTLEVMNSPERGIHVYVVQSSPLPVTITAITTRGDTRDA